MLNRRRIPCAGGRSLHHRIIRCCFMLNLSYVAMVMGTPACRLTGQRRLLRPFCQRHQCPHAKSMSKPPKSLLEDRPDVADDAAAMGKSVRRLRPLLPQQTARQRYRRDHLHRNLACKQLGSLLPLQGLCEPQDIVPDCVQLTLAQHPPIDWLPRLALSAADGRGQGPRAPGGILVSSHHGTSGAGISVRRRALSGKVARAEDHIIDWIK